MIGMMDDWMVGFLNWISAKTAIQKSGNPPSQPSARAARAGFTLIELLVVLGIVGVLIGISVPTVVDMVSPKHRLRKDARSLMNALNEARWTAMNKKIRIDVRVDPLVREVRAVESEMYRSLMHKDPYGFTGLDEAQRMVAMSNRFERVVAFDEDTLLEAFTMEDIEVEIDEEEDELFQRLEKNGDYFQSLESETNGVVAIVFNHLGGCDGGGISLVRGTYRLDIACDILTGRAKLVTRNDLEDRR